MRRFTRLQVWAGSNVVMGSGVLLPSVWLNGWTVALSALCVGGTFMIVTLAGVQEVRARARGDETPLVARMTAAFALGQIAGPIASSLLLHVPAFTKDGLNIALQLAALSVFAAALGLWRINCREAALVSKRRSFPMPADAVKQGFAPDARERLPMLSADAMNDAQRAGEQALTDGPRKGVYGPFLPLLRSPKLLDCVARTGEYLRFDSVLPADVRELVTCAVARHTSNQFEWVMHAPLAIKAGVAQSALDSLLFAQPIDKGVPAPGLLAHVAISKFLDHQPLYRQESQCARLGVALRRSTLAGWLGQLEVLIEPLVERLIKHLHAEPILHADETTVPALDPGTGRTATAYL